QLGGMPTPRTGETLRGTGAQVLDDGLRIIAPETGEDVTEFHVNGARYALEIAEIVGAKRAYMKGGSPSCDREGVTGEVLRRAGIKVVRVP
ncbi:MAG: 2-thiouracil desulfurase family protein, partial [Planctomycetota bacterium]